MGTHLGIDISRYQVEPLPWREWIANGLEIVFIQISHGLDPEPQAREHLAGAVAAGVPYIGAYHFLMPGDGGAQAAAFLLSLRPRHKFAALDVEPSRRDDGTVVKPTAADVLNWLAVFKDTLPLLLYGNDSLLTGVLAQHPELKRYPLWWSEYGPYKPGTYELPLRTIDDPPYREPHPPAGTTVWGWQMAGDNGRFPPWKDGIDLTRWADQFGTNIGADFTDEGNLSGVLMNTQVRLSLHHAAHGGEMGKLLAIGPRYAFFLDEDLGASVNAQSVTTCIGRLNDAGKLDGQGFDVNRYIEQGNPPEQVALTYYNFLLPSITANPKIAVWQGPNEQVPESDDKAEAANPSVKSAYDAKRKAFMLWYAEFCYQLAARLNVIGKRAAVGAWSSGLPRPEHDLWRFWGRALQASRDFNALQVRHDYALDTSLSQARYAAREWRQLGYSGLRQVATELGTDPYGAGWRGKYGNDFDAFWNGALKPWLDAVSVLPDEDNFEYDGCLWIDGGSGQWANSDVTGTPIVARLAAYQAPARKGNPMPYYTDAQVAQIKAILDAPTQPPAPAPTKHTLSGWTNQQVINFFYGVFKGYAELGQAVTMPNPLTTAWRGQPYTGPAIEDMSLTVAQKQQLIAALPAG